MLEHKCSQIIKKRDIAVSRHHYHLLSYVSPLQPHSPGDLHKHKAEGTSPSGALRTSHQTGRVTVSNREGLRHRENIAKAASKLRPSLNTARFISNLTICFFLLQYKFQFIKGCV